MECQMNWGERNLGGLNHPYANFTPATPDHQPLPTDLAAMATNPPLLVWKSEAANVCARMSIVVLSGLYGDCVAAATAHVQLWWTPKLFPPASSSLPPIVL